MKTGYSALFLIVIVLSMAIVVQIDFIQTADAVKAQGTKSSKYGMATKDKVCGDRLCTPEDFTSTGERKSLPALSDSSITSQMAIAKMERLFELHRIQLLSAWDSLDDSEKSQMMKMLDKMYEKMQSMNLVNHMKHMSEMMDGEHHDSLKEEHGMKDKHGMGCSCGKGGHDSSSGKDGHSCSSKEGGHDSSSGKDGHSCCCHK